MSDCGKTSPPSSGSGNTPVGAATTSCKTCAITSETVTTARADRSRKRIGIAERVKLIASPAGSYTWSVSGGGTLNSTSGSTVTFTAGDRTSTSTITASQGSCTCNIVFTIVEPNGAYQVQFGSTTHTQGTASAGFRGITYLLPKDVSFENIEINEGTVAGVATGSLLGLNGRIHPPWPTWASVGEGTATTGSVVQGPNQTGSTYFDYVMTGTGSGPWTAGTWVWPIPWEFRVNGGAKKPFTTLTHQAALAGPSGLMTQSKGGVTVSALPGDPTVLP